MADVSLSIAEVFEQAFGYRPSAFERGVEDYFQDNYTEGYSKDNIHPYGVRRTTSKSQSLVGVDNLGRDYYMPVTLDKYVLHHPVVSVSGKKRIIETPLTERQGTVKELINIENWEITIRGLIIDEKGDYPEAAVQEMVDLFHINKAVKIECGITDLFLMRTERKGDNTVVVRELRFPEVKGIMNVRPYELKLVSDAPFSLEEIS